MSHHNLTPIYKPCSWSIDPAALEIDDTPEQRALEAQFGKQIVDAMCARMEANFTAALPMKRNRVAEEMGEDYLPAPTLDQLRFEIFMLSP